MPSTVGAAASIVYRTHRWSFLQKRRFTAVDCGLKWIEYWGLKCFWFSGEDSPDYLKHRWIKEEWFVMPPLKAAPTSLRWGVAVAILTLPSSGTTAPFHSHISWHIGHKIKLNDPISLYACLPLQSSKLGDRRCFWCLSHALIYVQNVSGVRI